MGQAKRSGSTSRRTHAGRCWDALDSRACRQVSPSPLLRRRPARPLPTPLPSPRWLRADDRHVGADRSGCANAGVISRRTRVPTAASAGRCRSTGPTTGCAIPDAASLDLTTDDARGLGLSPTARDSRRSLLKERPATSYGLYASAPGLAERAADRRRARLPARERYLAALHEHLVASRDDVRRRDPAALRQRRSRAQSRPTARSVTTNDLFIGGNAIWSEFFDG